MIDLNDITVFVRVVQSGSFSAAARSLGRPKTSVSRCVARLEAELDTRLLHRTTRSLQLTSMGQAYYDQVTQGLDLMHGANEAVRPEAAIPSGKLRILAPVSFGDHFLTDQLVAFLRKYQRTSIELILTDTDIDLVANRIDLSFRIEASIPDSSFVARKIAITQKILVASARYVAERGHPASLQALADHDCIILGDGLRNIWSLVARNGVSAVPISGRLAATTTLSVLRAVELGFGIALLPVNLVSDGIAAGELTRILPDYTTEMAALYAIYPSRRHVPAALKALVDEIARIAHPVTEQPGG